MPGRALSKKPKIPKLELASLWPAVAAIVLGA
jgi:hypothetical protein